MFSVKKCLLGLGLGAGLLLTGCAATDAPPQSTLVPSSTGVACSMCQVVWVKVADTNQKNRIVGYHMTQKMACPDCMDAVQSFLNGGKLEHTCKACGGEMTICEAHGN